MKTNQTHIDEQYKTATQWNTITYFGSLAFFALGLFMPVLDYKSIAWMLSLIFMMTSVMFQQNANTWNIIKRMHK